MSGTVCTSPNMRFVHPDGRTSVWPFSHIPAIGDRVGTDVVVRREVHWHTHDGSFTARLYVEPAPEPDCPDE